MRTVSIGMIFASIQKTHAEIMLVDDVGLKNSQRGAMMLSDVAQRLRRGYGDNVNVVGGIPSKGYVTRGPHIEKYVPVSGMLRNLRPVVVRNLHPQPKAVSKNLNTTPQGYKRLRFPNPSTNFVVPSNLSIPKPSLGPVYSPVLNPEITVSTTQSRSAQSTRSATKSNSKVHRTTTHLPVEHPREGESSDYGVEIDMPEKTHSEPSSPSEKRTDPTSDNQDVFPLSDDTEPSKDPIVRIDSPVKIDMPEKEESAPEDVLKAAKQISNILIPRMRRRKYARRHNSNIQSAGKARQMYLDYKLIESRENLKSIEKKLGALRDLYRKMATKLKSLRDERDQARTRILSARSALENSENTSKSLQEEICRNEGQIKLEEIEVVKLERAISEEKNKLSILSDQQKIYQSRLEAFGSKEGTRREELKSSENQLKDYDRLLEQIQKDAENLQARMAETETKRRLEIDTQNRLEIEKKEVEDSNHLPLFVLYD